MTYSITFSKSAEKFLEKLPENISQRISDKFDSIKENPFHYLEHYEGDYYKIRIGDYRALIDIDFKNKILIIRVLDNRSRIYKR